MIDQLICCPCPQNMQLQQCLEQEVISQLISVMNHSAFDFMIPLSQPGPIPLKDTGEGKPSFKSGFYFSFCCRCCGISSLTVK